MKEVDMGFTSILWTNASNCMAKWVTSQSKLEASLPNLCKLSYQCHPIDVRSRHVWVWFHIPKEVWLMIFGFLEPRKRWRMSEVCRAWYGLSREGSLWKSISGIEFDGRLTHNALVHLGLLAKYGLRHLDCRGLKDLAHPVVCSLADLCPRIYNVNFQGCHELSPSSLVYFLYHQTHLVRLNVTGLNMFSDITLDILSTLHSHSLEHVNLSFCSLITHNGLLTFLSSCKNLRTVKIAKLPITEQVMMALGGLPITLLDMSYTVIQNEWFMYLSGTRLTHISLSHCTIKDEGLMHLICLPLIHLNVSFCNVTDESMAYLPHSLRTLDVSSTHIHRPVFPLMSLRHLMLSDTPVVLPPHPWPQMEYLALDLTPLYDDALLSLLSWPRLRRVDAWDTHVSRQAVIKASQSLEVGHYYAMGFSR